MIRKIIIGFVLVFGLLQFFTVNHENPEIMAGADFIELTNTPTEVSEILVTSCYDCHSNQTVYPWYSSIAPVSWWINDHVEEARDELNFSEWGSFTSKRKTKKLKEIIEEVEEGEMPLSNYTLMHSSTKLNETQKEQLLNWVKYLQLKS
ncbi:MAG: hypothetical protein ACJA2N_000093 [Salibacteraceae bacterium]|jgi:hypothetical protein